jgi:hypothetical protein
LIQGGITVLFQKGRSGNPGGRPKLGQSFKELYEAELERLQFDHTDPETQEVAKINAKRLLVLQRIGRALRGSEHDQTVIENRVDGTPAETIAVMGGGELEIRFTPMTADDLKALEGVSIVDALPETPDAESTGA